MALGSTITQITESGLKPGLQFPSLVVSGILTSTNFKTGTTDVHSTGVTVATSVVGSAVTSNSTGIDITGIVTATTFKGALTGNVTGNASGTAGGLSGTPNITIGTLNASTGSFSSNVTISGNLGVAGTVTYEDVARVDATGISTFREGFKLGPLAGIALTAYKDGSIRTTGIITANTYYGSGANLTGITGTTINNNANNRLITGSGTANTLEGEANLTYDGTTLKFASAQSKINLNTSDGSDNKVLSLHGGGDSSQSRGAGLSIYGNEATNYQGKLFVMAGNSGNANGTIDFYTGGAERVRIDSSGRLGINESASLMANGMFTVKLDTNKHIAYSHAQSEVGNVPALVAYQDNGSLQSMGFRGVDLRFATGSSERFRINSSGYVGINETNPSTLLNLKGTAGGGVTGVKIVNTADEYTALIMDANRTTTGNALGILDGRWNSNQVCAIYLSAGADTTNKDDGRLYLQTRPSGGSIQNRLQLTEDGVWYGSLYNTNTNPGLSANVFVFSNDSMGRASSSGKYKKNIETMQDSYADKILTMRPTWYQADETTVNIPQDQGDDWGYWGFIAEEVADIDPRLVTWRVADYATDPSDSTKTIRTPLSKPEPDNVAYDRFVPHLVNLVKRQSVEIETLKTKVAALESA